MRECLSPIFPETAIGKYLMGVVTERNPWHSSEALVQTIMGGNTTADVTPRLGDIKLPTLVINGEFDSAMAGGTQTAELIPGAIHKVLPGTGHACPIEDPAGFDALVIEFLEANGLMPPLGP
jgi:3-oxoadipate enol-lactonase